MRPYHFDFDQTQFRRARAVAMARPIAWHRSPPPLPPRRGGLPEIMRQLVTLVRMWRTRIRERQELAGLDHRMQRDIGLTPSEIARECNKPFWRA